MSLAGSWGALFWGVTGEGRVVRSGSGLMARVRLGGHGLAVIVVAGLGRGIESRRRWRSGGSILRYCFLLLRRLFVTGEGDIGGSLEELFPEFGAFPYVLGVFCVLFDDGQDTGGNDAMGATEVVVDLCESSQLS